MSKIVTIDGEAVIQDLWHKEDILEVADNMGTKLTDAQVLEVMHLIVKTHDANVGINWDVIEANINFFMGV